MKLLQIIKEEVVPLSRKQNIVLMTIIACVFQFTLFFAPALADAAVEKANIQENDQETLIKIDSMVKEAIMDPEAAKLAGPDAIYKATGANASISTAHSTSTQTNTMPDTKASSSVKVIRESVHTMTAYNSEAGQTDDSPCITANGFNVCEHGVEDTIAANFLPLGTKVMIPDLYGDRVFVVRDRMNKKHPDRVDIWMKNRSDAIKFGIRVAKIQVVE